MSNNMVRIFLESYRDGRSIEEACSYAGYPSEMLPRLLSDPMIGTEVERISRDLEGEGLKNLATGIRSPGVLQGKLNREERDMILSDIARDKEENTSSRLKAVELLGKAEGDYVVRSEVILSASNSDKMSISELEELLRKLSNRIGSIDVISLPACKQIECE